VVKARLPPANFDLIPVSHWWHPEGLIEQNCSSACSSFH